LPGTLQDGLHLDDDLAAACRLLSRANGLRPLERREDLLLFA
jgi:hypothetical protein